MSIPRWISLLPSRSLPVQLAALAALMLLAYGCVILTVANSGAMGVVAASLAAAVCWASAAGALSISHWCAGAANGVAGMLLPMMARTAPPLLLAVIVRLRGHGLAEAGFVYYLVGFYLLALAAEVPLSLPGGRRSPERCEVPEGKGWKVNG